MDRDRAHKRARGLRLFEEGVGNVSYFKGGAGWGHGLDQGGTGFANATNGGWKMKRLIEETEDDGFSIYLGEDLTLFCMNYIYTGKLIGANSEFVELENPKIVYETGAFTDKAWKDAQALPEKIRVRTAAVEAYGKVK